MKSKDFIKILMNYHFGIERDKSYITNADDIMIANIKDFKQNGITTTIIPFVGEKVVVKCQKEDKDCQSNLLGFHIALIKYFIYNKNYSDCVNEIFESDNKNDIARAILVSKIGLKNYSRLYNKFFFEEN